jgi:hypothetical protein
MREAIERLPKCKTCERVRYPEKFCGTCQFNPKLSDNYKLDKNVQNVLEELEHVQKD